LPSFIQETALENGMKKLVFLPLAAALAASALLAGCDSMKSAMGMSSAPAKEADGAWVGPNGMSLYTFDRDAMGAGKSMCNGPCATNWPPLMASGSDSASGDWSIVTRDDGSRQWAYKGKPVYYWSKDGKPGDRTGDGFNNAWHVAKP
jgi:predicted lipoprotein with Yx(FWY)xxD motif